MSDDLEAKLDRITETVQRGINDLAYADKEIWSSLVAEWLGNAIKRAVYAEALLREHAGDDREILDWLEELERRFPLPGERDRGDP